MSVKVILYDKKTQFNEVPVDIINNSWGDIEHALVYKDDKFTGIAQPLGTESLEYWQKYFEEYFTKQEENHQEQESNKKTLDEIKETVIQTDNYVLDLMEGVATSYESQEENSMVIMEGLASIYELQSTAKI